jgi:hypothetical protein
LVSAGNHRRQRKGIAIRLVIDGIDDEDAIAAGETTESVDEIVDVNGGE